MIKKILFLLTFLLTTLGGGKLWAENYTVTDDGVYVNTSTGTSAFAAGTTYQATSNISMYIGSSGWTISSGNKYITGSDAPKYYNDTNWNYNSGGFPTKGAYLTFTPSVNGRFTLRGTKNGKSGIKYLYITSAVGTYVGNAEVIFNNGEAEYNSDKHGYPISPTDDVNSKISFTAEFDMTANTTYYIIIEGYSNWSFTGFSFTPAITTINVSDLNYSVGPSGKADAGLNRTVGGFNLAFDKGISSQGVKYNGGGIIFLGGANGKMTVSMDSNNSSISITKILFNISSYADASTYLSVETGGGTLSKVSDTQVQWTGSASSVTFAHSTSDATGITLNSMVVTTSALPTYSKITPTVTLSPSSASIKVGTAGTYSPTTNSTPANFAWTWSHTDLASTNVAYAAGNGSSDVGDAGSFTTTASSVAGSYTMSATFDGTSNPWFNSATISDAYTLTVASAVPSTPDATVQTYPYTWNFADGSSTWGSSSTQLPISDWEGSDTYYHCSVPDALTGFNIDAIKGLRFQNISWLGLDWGCGHLWMTGTNAEITIPNLQANQVVTFVMEGREGEGASATSSSVIAPNTDPSSSISIPRTDGKWTEYDFKVTSDGSATFRFTKAVSIRKIIIRKAAPTLVWTETHSETLETPNITYGQGTTVTHTATASVTDGGTVPGIKYRSGNTEIATVDNTGKVTPRSAGTVDIYAYTEAGDYATKEISYSLTITEGTADFTFVPQKGKVGVGKWIIPRLRFPSIAASAVTTLKVSKVEILDGDNKVTDTYDNDSKIDSYFKGSPGFTIENYADLKNSWETNSDTPIGVHKVNVKFTGVTVGTKARVTVKFESNGFVDAITQYTIEVTAADAVNFDWKSGTPSDVYIYENTYMPIPHLSGNANGNNHYSNGSKNASEYFAYVYDIKQKDDKFQIKWNEKDYKLKEGVPDYYLTDESNNATTNAYLFWANSDNKEYSDTLLVYAKTAGTVRLHAKDSQNNQECDFITIHIVANDLDTKAATAVSANTYPFTWDFTGNNISESDLRGSQYWDEVSTGQFQNTALWQNTDFADSDQDDATSNRLPKYFLTGASSDTNGGTLMPFFKGMKVILGNSTYNSKIHKIRVSTNATAGEAKVYFSGGTHELILPRLGVTSSEPANYKLYVKVKGDDNSTELAFRRNGANISGASYKGTSQISNTESSIFSVDVDKNDVMSIYVANLHIYWIALTTEAKTLAKFDNTTYWESTYSYTKDLDLSKSKEVHPKVIAHYASEFSGQNEVKLTEVPNDAVPSGTGMLLKAETTNNPGASYFIANAENVSVYSAPSPISGTNYLKANPEVGTKINANTTIDDKQYTNFTLAYRYKVVHAGGGIDSNYTPADDWSFYRIAPSGITVSNKNLAYLQVPGDLYIDAYSSRRAGDATGANPASQELLKIVFDDDNNTGTTDLDISTVTPQTVDNGAWYTLQGVRVSAPLKGGIYIHNGKKIVVK